MKDLEKENGGPRREISDLTLYNVVAREQHPSARECVVYRQTEVFGFARFWGARRQKLVISHAHARGGFRLHLRCDSLVGLVTWEMRDGAEEAWSEQRRSVPQPTGGEDRRGSPAGEAGGACRLVALGRGVGAGFHGIGHAPGGARG